MIICADSDRDIAYQVIDRVRVAIELHYIDDLQRNMTISVGIAECNPEEDFEAAYKQADEVLYEAKKAGRNRVVISNPAHA